MIAIDVRRASEILDRRPLFCQARESRQVLVATSRDQFGFELQRILGLLGQVTPDVIPPLVVITNPKWLVGGPAKSKLRRILSLGRARRDWHESRLSVGQVAPAAEGKEVV